MADNFGLKIGVEGEREFKSALYSINESFKVLGSEMKLVESQFSKNDTSVQSLTAKNQVLNKEIETQKQKIELLKNALNEVEGNYDFIIIDCPPSLGLLNTNALTAADSVLIPVQSEYYALEGITQLLQTIRLVQRLFNPALKIEGVLLTMYDARTNLSAEVGQEIRKHFKEKAYKTYIPRNIKLSEAPSSGLCIFDYGMQSEGAKAYVALTREVLANNAEEANG